MAGAGSSAVEKRKVEMEDEVFHKILRYWEELQGLQFLQECGMATTPILMAKLEKYRERLHVANTVDIFDEDNVYQLMLYKERRILERIADSDSFLKTYTSDLNCWMTKWRSFVQEELYDVIRTNFFK